MADETHNVPKYFADFVKQNADEHGRLAAEIAATRGDLTTEIARAEARSTRWMVGTMIGTTTIAVTVLTVAMTIIVG